MSTRRQDVRGEQALALFLDKYFYPELINMGIISEYSRNYDVKKQKSGLDVLVLYDSSEESIDEKAQLYFIGKPLPSFIVEINFISENVNDVVDGWFVNPSNKTDMYLFAWINKASNDKLYRIVSEDFEEIEVVLIRKNQIKTYLKNEGFFQNRIRAYAEKIREGKLEAKSVKGKGFHFSYTMNRDERPINIVLEKTLIEKLAEHRFLVSKKKVLRIEA